MNVFLFVIDSFGIGALPDAELYGDEGANTALHICENVPGGKWPFLRRLGLGNASRLLGNELPGCEAVEAPEGLYGVMAEKSPGKDTTTGHWEIAGIVLEKPFTTFPSGYPSFPSALTDAFKREVAPGYLGNCAASGTEIIQRLGQEHIRTGYPIIYTSSDSVLQIAAHEDIIPVDELYGMCEKARKICDSYMVGRVIARPFTGNAEKGFTRTERRHDFSIALPGKSALDILRKSGVRTTGIGKIGDIFNMQGLDESFPVKGNAACLEKVFSLINGQGAGTGDRCGGSGGRECDRLIFVNLVDTDMNYGHRRDIRGYFDAVSAVDSTLEKMAGLINKNDVMIVTADHGCDPSFRGTDHTREYVPLLFYTRDASLPGRLSERYGRRDANSPESCFGVRESFSFVSELLYAVFGIKKI